MILVVLCPPGTATLAALAPAAVVSPLVVALAPLVVGAPGVVVGGRLAVVGGGGGCCQAFFPSTSAINLIAKSKSLLLSTVAFDWSRDLTRYQ